MTQEQIDTAFENRWQIYGIPSDTIGAMGVKAYCRKFFEAGIAISQPIDPITPTDPIITTTTFDSFWQLYDKRVGKQKCITLWGKLTLKEQAACMDYIPLYKQAQPDKQFRKNPETFLRNKSWNDEIIIRNNPDTQRTQRIAASTALVAKYTAADSPDAQ